MKKDRLLALARLASGAAVVTMGPLAACTPSTVTTAPTGGDGTNPPHTINAPATATPAPTDTAPDLSGVHPQPGVNAPPPVTTDATDAGADTDAGGGGLHRFPPHGNAMPPTAPTHS